MPLSPGDRLGPYEILAPLGKGGMGEVFRARDTKLDREAAIKVLPAALAQDRERLSRFEREAKVLASLNHPNIAQIYSVEESGRIHALAMELVPGANIAGPLPVETVIDYARQICAALEAAHDKGIVHRDLKPANIMVTPDGTIKVLDFGLARLGTAESDDPGNSPTMMASPTQAGMILGTAAYMSPEQARGKVVDKRADIWAFGVVLYEIATGKHLFAGETVTDILASVVKEEPDLSTVPPKLRRLIQRCLEKDPKKRLRDISGAELLLEAGVPALSGTRGGSRIWPVIAAVAILVAAAIWWLKPAPPSRHVVTRFELRLPEGQNFTRIGRHLLAISPDGTKLAYVANQQLYLRTMDQLEAQPIRGTNEDPIEPVFSPDGQWLAYAVPAGGAGTNGGIILKKIAIAGGAPVTLSPLPVAPFGATWRDGTIVYGMNDSGVAAVQAISDSGGAFRTLIAGDPKKERVMQPQLLADGKHVVFVSVPRAGRPGGEGEIVVAALNGKERRILVSAGTDPRVLTEGVLPSSQLLYIHQGTLLAVPFDTRRLAVTGGPVPLVEGIMETTNTWAGQFAISSDGTLAFSPGASGLAEQRTLTWVDRQGHEEPLPAKPHSYALPRLSPDGSRVAVDSLDEENDIWVFDLTNKTLRRLTFGPAFENDPVWSGDGKYLFFSSGPSRKGPGSLADVSRQAADGSGAVEALTRGLEGGYPLSLSPDGKSLLIMKSPGLYVLPIEPKGAPHALIADERFSRFDGEISPDGRWIAYDSNESGRQEIYVRPFPGVDGGRWQISPEGGHFPAWAPSGRELFFVTAANKMVAVPVQAGNGFSYGNPQPLFDAGAYFKPVTGRPYDISADGKRFLMVKNALVGNTVARPSIVVVSHWFDEVKAKMPAQH